MERIMDGPDGIVRFITVIIAGAFAIVTYLGLWLHMIEQTVIRGGDYPPFDWWIGAHIALITILELWAWFGTAW